MRLFHYAVVEAEEGLLVFGGPEDGLDVFHRALPSNGQVFRKREKRS